MQATAWGWAPIAALALTLACTDPAALARFEQAIRNGETGVVAQHLTEGISANATLSDGWTPLTLAASLGHLEMVTMLVDAGGDLEQARRVGVERLWTPLGWAAGGGHSDVVALLLARGARVDARNSRHQTPLMAAALEGHDAVMAVLVAAGADQEARDAAGRTVRDMVR